MAEEHQGGDDEITDGRFDGHRLSEFIYGTVIGLVATVGVSESEGIRWWEAALLIISGALAIWAAHAYSILLSKHLVNKRPLEAHEISETLTGSWPIVSAGVFLSLPLLPVVIGLWSVETAMWISGCLGILVLALIGIGAGTLMKDPWPRRLLWALVSAGLGIAVVAIEFAVHH
jgi:VIT1/CCC1 family predicted Fe2+/Mn2+ transporter